MNQTQYDFLAELKFRASEEGDRTTEARNSYRPGIRFLLVRSQFHLERQF